jgi:arylsulfatase A-like enzyme
LKNILYIDIDSLRPDHLGCYGYHRATSPNIDKIANEGLRFENVYASDVPCHPSRTALWSGRHGRRTGVVGHGGTACEPFREGASREWAGTFQDDGWMKALRNLGYHTATFSSFGERHGTWHWYAGFNEVFNCGKEGLENAEEVILPAIDWVNRKGTEKPWFLHVNVWDPHTPYRVPSEYGDPFANEPLPEWLTQDVLDKCLAGYGPHSANEPTGFDNEGPDTEFDRAPVPLDTLSKVREWFNGYDTGVHYADYYVGKLIDTLKDRGLYDDTIIVISADHGENLGELNVWGDHQTADRHTCNIPLIIRWPGDDAINGTDNNLHYHFDWAATLIDRLGGDVPAVWDGESFSENLGTPSSSGREHLILSQGAWAVQRSVVFLAEGCTWLMMRSYHDGYKNLAPIMLFNLTHDPHEQSCQAETRPDLVAQAMAIMDDWQGDMAIRSPSDVDPLMTVMREGGPFHTAGMLPDYLKRLEETGRAEHAQKLRLIHPNDAKGANQ